MNQSTAPESHTSSATNKSEKKRPSRIPDLTEDDLVLLNSKLGKRLLCANPKVNVSSVLRQIKYENRLRKAQVELVKLQTSVIENRRRLVILFEGRDAAGKGGAIRRITAHINPRHFRVVALNKPTPDERGQWYFQRYVEKLPRPGEIVFFDRSWYNRAVVEPVNGFCTEEEYQRFAGQVNEFERMVVESGIQLIKFYFMITKEEQAKRFESIRKDPRKRWKMTPVDARAQELWNKYSEYEKRLFDISDTKLAPWKVIHANKKTDARIEAIESILKLVDY